ncbi:Apyrase [Gryllus bimaculatus]|nr:Apyrase [Gryllus bimaculatus]
MFCVTCRLKKNRLVGTKLFAGEPLSGGRYYGAQTNLRVYGQAARCIGGYARVVTMATQLLSEQPNALLLNGGHNTHGTVWDTVHGHEVAAELLNRLPWDAFTLGPRDFDQGPEGVAPLAKALKAPVVVANMDASKEPAMEGVTQASVVAERGGRKVGVVGAVNPDCEKLKDAGVEIIVVLSSAGIDADEEMAKSDPNVDIVVSSGRILLYNGTPPDGSTPYDQYPMMFEQPSGRKVAVVQAGHDSKYLGNLTAFFDDAGNLESAVGNPVYLDRSTAAALEPLAKAVAAAAESVVGRSAVLLEQANDVCQEGECNLGSFVADAYVRAYAGRGLPGCWTLAAIGITNSGGLRAPIQQGDVTLGDVMRTLPHGNTVSLAEVRGELLRAALEQAVSPVPPPGPRPRPRRPSRPRRRSLQVSGLRVTYDLRRPAGQRLGDVAALCHRCQVPRYEPLQPDAWYPVAINSYLLRGGDGFDVFTQSRVVDEGPHDLSVVMRYLQKQSPVVQPRDGRITVEGFFSDPAENPDEGETAPNVEVKISRGKIRYGRLDKNIKVEIPQDVLPDLLLQ